MISYWGVDHNDEVSKGLAPLNTGFGRANPLSAKSFASGKKALNKFKRPTALANRQPGLQQAQLHGGRPSPFREGPMPDKPKSMFSR